MSHNHSTTSTLAVLRRFFISPYWPCRDTVRGLISNVPSGRPSARTHTPARAHPSSRTVETDTPTRPLVVIPKRRVPERCYRSIVNLCWCGGAHHCPKEANSVFGDAARNPSSPSHTTGVVVCRAAFARARSHLSFVSRLLRRTRACLSQSRGHSQHHPAAKGLSCTCT
jgi:hypothetical protein